MNEEIKVSVIVPIYNVAHFLPTCLDSILSQDHTNLDVILVDDGSKDTSGCIADEYAQKDTRIRVIHKANGGVSVARNTGMDVAQGEYICFVDGDDYLSNDYVSHLLGMATKYHVDVAVTTRMYNTFSTSNSFNPHIGGG